MLLNIAVHCQLKLPKKLCSQFDDTGARSSQSVFPFSRILITRSRVVLVCREMHLLRVFTHRVRKGLQFLQPERAKKISSSASPLRAWDRGERSCGTPPETASHLLTGLSIFDMCNNRTTGKDARTYS